jgi:hypothetical protein
VKNIGPLSVFFFPEFFLERKKIEKFLEYFSSESLTNYANFGGEICQNFDINKLEKKPWSFIRLRAVVPKQRKWSVICA